MPLNLNIRRKKIKEVEINKKRIMKIKKKNNFIEFKDEELNTLLDKYEDMWTYQTDQEENEIEKYNKKHHKEKIHIQKK